MQQESNTQKADGRSDKMGNNKQKNEEVKSLITKYKLSKEQQRKLHDYITGQNYSRKEIEEIIMSGDYLR